MYEYKVKRVVKVVDGDTVDVLIDLGFDITIKKRVRIAGIDTPEKRTTNSDEKRRGIAATQFTEAWLRANEGNIIVRTELDGSFEKYGRLLGHFFTTGGLNFSECIVEAGLAWLYDGGTKVKDMSLLKEV